jgi:aromatic-L-amino-acid decarboxylase
MAEDAAANPLGLDAETMRRLGYRTVDMLVERLTDPGSLPATRSASRDEMAARLSQPPPEAPTSFDAILAELERDVLPFASVCDHPRYFAYIPACGTWPGALGDFMAAALNVYAGSWAEASGPSQAELTILDWFKEWVGYPAEASGVLVSGGSAANLTALACAREARLGPMDASAVAYCSDQAHSSVARGARVLGFRPDQLRVLPSDAEHRLRVDALRGAVAADLEDGRRPLFVAASGGSTNTGAIDPLEELAAVCAELGLWLHVDAAYGGFASLTERGRAALAGIELADSITLDPHKWLYQPIECGALLVRDGDLLRRAFEITPDYLKDSEAGLAEVNFSDYGIQLTRMTRAFKLWISLKYFGVAAFREVIDRCLDLALLAQQIVEEMPELELLSPAKLGIIAFRRRAPEGSDSDAVNRALVAGFAAGGEGLVSSTRLRGDYAIRMCILNHTSTEADVRRVLEHFATASVEAAAPAAGATTRTALGEGATSRTPDVEQGRGGQSGVEDTLALGALSPFRSLGEEQLLRVARRSRERRAEAGETLVRRWDAARDFFVIEEGMVAVDIDGGRIRELGPGDFFGELAAADWGGSFGYSRLATVTALTPAKLLVLDGGTLRDLMRELPELDRLIGAAVRERLRQV